MGEVRGKSRKMIRRFLDCRFCHSVFSLLVLLLLLLLLWWKVLKVSPATLRVRKAKVVRRDTSGRMRESWMSGRR